jgi:hypothetical protein
MPILDGYAAFRNQLTADIRAAWNDCPVQWGKMDTTTAMVPFAAVLVQPIARDFSGGRTVQEQWTVQIIGVFDGDAMGDDPIGAKITKAQALASQLIPDTFPTSSTHWSGIAYMPEITQVDVDSDDRQESGRAYLSLTFSVRMDVNQ